MQKVLVWRTRFTHYLELRPFWLSSTAMEISYFFIKLTGVRRYGETRFAGVRFFLLRGDVQLRHRCLSLKKGGANSTLEKLLSCYLRGLGLDFVTLTLKLRLR